MLKLVFILMSFVFFAGCSLQAEAKDASQPAKPPPIKLQASDINEAKAFQAAALKMLAASNNSTKLVLNSIGRQSDVASYMMLKKVRDYHRYTDLSELRAPAALRDDPPTKEFLNTLHTVMAVRSQAFSNGMDAADGGKVSDVTAMLERIDRAKRHAGKAAEQLAALAAHYQTLK